MISPEISFESDFEAVNALTLEEWKIPFSARVHTIACESLKIFFIIELTAVGPKIVNDNRIDQESSLKISVIIVTVSV